MTETKRMEGRVALVTGASRGIGRAVAIAMAREGAQVVLLARTSGALEDVDDEIREFGGKATLVTLDLTDKDKVNALGPSLYKRWKRLDVLVGNAGTLGPLSPLGHITGDDWDKVLQLNLTANWRLIRSLDPLLRHSDAGRAIFVTSGAATGKYAYWGPYAVSKAGLEALVKTYAHELDGTGVTVNLVNPGPIATRMRAAAFPGEDQDTLAKPEDIAPLFLEMAQPSFEKTGEIVAFPEWLANKA